MYPSSLQLVSGADLYHFCDFRRHHLSSFLVMAEKPLIVSSFTLKAFSFHSTDYLIPS
jgi:hypothetical protein